MSTPIQPGTQPTSGPVPEPVPNDDAQVRALAAQIAAMTADARPALNLSQAVVADTNLNGTPPTASITIAGSSTQVDGVRFMSGYMPVIGDTVSVLIQNASVLIIGHTVDLGTANATLGGWVNPTLSSGFTTNGNSNGNLAYRLVIDNSVYKMQWKGSVAHTGTNTAIISGAGALVAPFVPASKRSLITARDTTTGAVSVGLDFGSDGTVTLTGATTGPAAHTHTMAHNHGIFRSLIGYLSQAGSDLGHSHDGSGAADLGGGATDVASNSTTSSSGSTVTHPGWISFNGLEYFL